MKRKALIFGIALATLFSLAACNWFAPSFEDLNPEGFYLIKVPSYLSSTSRLGERAALQLQNLDEDIYVLLRTTPLDSLAQKFPEDQLEDFFNLHMDNLYQQLENPVVKGPDSMDNPYYRMLRGSIRGEYKGNLIAHQLVVFEDSSHVYQLLQWMPATHWKDCQQDMELMIQSLRPSN